MNLRGYANALLDWKITNRSQAGRREIPEYFRPLYGRNISDNPGRPFHRRQPFCCPSPRVRVTGGFNQLCYGYRAQVYAYPEDRERAIGLLKEHGVFENFEMKYRKKDGGIAWGLHNLRFVRDEQGNVAYIEGTFQNITDRKQMEEALKQGEQRFRSLSEASLEAILFIEDGIIVDANQALNRLLGYDGENLRGRVATDFIVPELRDFSDERMRTRAEGIYETLGLRKDGSTIPIEINAREFAIDGRRSG